MSTVTRPELYTLQQVAELADRHLNSVYRDVRAGRLQAVRIGGRPLRVHRADLERYLNGEPVQPR